MNTPLHSRALLRHIRFGEVFVLQGTPLMGALFSIGFSGPLNTSTLETIGVFLIGSILLVAHVFTLNDWADIAYGLKAPDPLVSSRRLFWFSIFLLLASLLVFDLIAGRVVVLGAVVAGFGFLYSHPKLNFKGTPVASSFPHLVGGFFHFLLGYAVFLPSCSGCTFSAWVFRGVLIALFFALTFTAGHLNHEVRDFELDSKNNVRTNAVTFGKRRTFIAGLIVFTLAYLCLILLTGFSLIISPLIFWLSIPFYILHLYWSLHALHAGLGSDVLDRFQIQYRSLYAVIGILMFLNACVHAKPMGLNQ
jgi:4-hydroxybenzoate polyprenyltransferase